MADIRYEIFRKAYEQLTKTKHDAELTGLDATVLPSSQRIIRYFRAGNEDIVNLKTNNLLPALMLSIGSGEFSLNRQNISGDLPEPYAPTTVLNAEAERMLLTVRLALTELSRTERYSSDGMTLNLEKSRSGRAFIVRNQLDYLLDATNFMALAQQRPGYAERSEVISAKVISSEDVESDIEDTIIDFRLEVIFKKQIMRSA